MAVEEELAHQREKSRHTEEHLISEAQRILKQDLLTERNILDNLKQYSKNIELVDEEDVSEKIIFNSSEIKQTAILYRLKFLDSKLYKPEFPYEAILKLKQHNKTFHKDLKHFYVLSVPEAFTDKKNTGETFLFSKTNYDNYALIHHWGKPLKASRKLKFWALRNFENLVFSLTFITLVITLSLPTRFITLDPKAEYWSSFRGAAFFHLLIFNTGVAVFITFGFSKNFSSSIWNRKKNFG